MTDEFSQEIRDEIRSYIELCVNRPETPPGFGNVSEIVDIIEKYCFLLDGIYSSRKPLDKDNNGRLFRLRKSLEACFREDIVRPLDNTQEEDS